jgi:hypothetical protein
VWRRRVGAGDQWVLTEVDPERLAWDAEHPTWPTNKPVFIGGQVPQEVHWVRGLHSGSWPGVRRHPGLVRGGWLSVAGVGAASGERSDQLVSDEGTLHRLSPSPFAATSYSAAWSGVR